MYTKVLLFTLIGFLKNLIYLGHFIKKKSNFCRTTFNHCCFIKYYIRGSSWAGAEAGLGQQPTDFQYFSPFSPLFHRFHWYFKTNFQFFKILNTFTVLQLRSWGDLLDTILQPKITIFSFFSSKHIVVRLLCGF